MENTEKTKTAQNEEYRIEGESKDRPEAKSGVIRIGMGDVRMSDVRDVLRSLLGVDDDDDDDDEVMPSDQFKRIHTVASFKTTMANMERLMDYAWRMHLDTEDYLDDEDQAKFMFLKDRIHDDLKELWDIAEVYTENMLMELDVWKNEADLREEEEDEE